MKKCAAAAAVIGTLLSAGVATAQIVDTDDEDYAAPPAERRAGFTAGVGVSVNAGALTAFPNDLTKIGQLEFEQDLAGIGLSQQVWLGGMLRDWLGFSVGFSSRSLFDGGETGTVNAVVLHLDAYPLWSLGGSYRDFGVVAEVGAGFGGVVRSDDPAESLADGGFMSSVSLGVFHETWRLYKFTLGPQLSYQQAFSASLTSHFVSLGLRTSFYSTLL